jgi:hypothetical protein
MGLSPINVERGHNVEQTVSLNTRVQVSPS